MVFRNTEKTFRGPKNRVFRWGKSPDVMVVKNLKCCHREIIEGGHRETEIFNFLIFFFPREFSSFETFYRGKISIKKHFFRKNTRAEFDPNFDFPYFQND